MTNAPQSRSTEQKAAPLQPLEVFALACSRRLINEETHDRYMDLFTRDYLSPWSLQSVLGGTNSAINTGKLPNIGPALDTLSFSSSRHS